MLHLTSINIIDMLAYSFFRSYYTVKSMHCRQVIACTIDVFKKQNYDIRCSWTRAVVAYFVGSSNVATIMMLAPTKCFCDMKLVVISDALFVY